MINDLRGWGNSRAQPHFSSEWMHKSFSLLPASCGINNKTIILVWNVQELKKKWNLNLNF